jgi:hypothetical protein
MGKQVVHGILPIKASSGFIVHVIYLVCLKEDTDFTASLQYGTVQQETQQRTTTLHKRQAKCETDGFDTLPLLTTRTVLTHYHC